MKKLEWQGAIVGVGNYHLMASLFPGSIRPFMWNMRSALESE